MTHRLRLRLKPEEFYDDKRLKSVLFKEIGNPVNDWRIIRHSIDSRQRQVWIDAEFEYATGDTDSLPLMRFRGEFKKVDDTSPGVVIVGSGPAGLFAALRALELGWKPIVIERGKPVEDRVKDIARLQREKIVNPDSNFCFGEGGAGTFSDGKLFTRSKKRGNVQEILELLHYHGAREEILYNAHPHIGSDKLPKVIKSIRETITQHGGEIYFNTKMKELIIKDGTVAGIITDDGRRFYGDVILATGHSARDVYEYLNNLGVRLEQKGFAMGVRLEHPQEVIDRMVYHNKEGRGRWLPPAEYKLATQIDGRGVYSFCMCPGGVIVPAVTEEGELVVNGMSASGRSGRWANSGMVVEIRPEDFPEYSKRGALGLLELQKDIEKKFFEKSRSIEAPAQRMKDFVEEKMSESLPRTSYVPGIFPADINSLLPKQIGKRLKKGLELLGYKNKGFLTNDAVLIGLESRTSTPVRIPRDTEKLHHPEMPGLYPAGEGAGYAGGIVSAAIDGRRAMDAVANNRKLTDNSD